MVPATTPVTVPEVRFTVATPGDDELHVPATVASVSTVDEPAQTDIVPAIGEGFGFTVNSFVVEQPAADVKPIVEVPAATADTSPVPLTVATEGLLLVQVPAGAVSVAVAPSQATAVPLMNGVGFTDTQVEAKHPLAIV